MFKSIKRYLSKNKKSVKHRRSCVDLDSVAASLQFQKDIGMVFDPTKKEENSRILNYFFIVGPVPKNDGKEKGYEPSLLFSYPSHKFPFSKSEFNRVIQFCYPEGFENLNSKVYKKKNIKSKTKKKVNKDKFVFGLNDQGTLYFCVVTRFYNNLFDTLSTTEYPICLVSVTSSTLLTTHFTFHKFLYFIITNGRIADGWETYLRTNSITIKSKNMENEIDDDDESDSNPISPFINESKSGTVYKDEDVKLDPNDDTLQLLDRHLIRHEFGSDKARLKTLEDFYKQNYGMHLMKNNPLFAVHERNSNFEEKADKNFFRVIETIFCFQLLEDRYQRISLRLDGENEELNLSFEIPTLSDQLYEIGRLSFKSLFKCLSIKDVARYYRAALLEHQILLISNDISTLTKCALATLVMVAPMSPKCAILPILPNDENFLEYLGTPTPFVFGALDTELLRSHMSRNPPDITVIDLTAGTVEYPDDVFHVPRIDVLKMKLRDITRGCYKPPSSTYELFNGRQQQQQQLNQEALSSSENVQSEKVFTRKKLNLRSQSSMSESGDISLTSSSVSLNDDNDSSSRLIARYSSDLSNSSFITNSKIMGDLMSSLFVLFNSLFVSQERLNGCRVRDTTDESKPIVVFVKDVYMLKVADTEIDFYDALVETQTFQAYCEETYKAPL